jgi:dihydrofolate reductase
MGRIRFYFAASLDGYIADPNGGVDYLEALPDSGDDDEGESYDAFIATIGTLVMGRATYQFVEENGSWPYDDDKRTIVLTHRPIEHPLCDLQTRVVEDFSTFARELRALPGGDAWIVGGGKVMGAFLAAGEADVIEMSIIPVAIGNGIPMFAASRTVLQLYELVKLSRTPSGIVRLVYERGLSSS